MSNIDPLFTTKIGVRQACQITARLLTRMQLMREAGYDVEKLADEIGVAGRHLILAMAELEGMTS